MRRVVISTSASARLKSAVAFLSQFPPAAEVLILGASRGAADDLARVIARTSGATFGLFRASLTELAGRAVTIAGGERVPGTQASTEAMAARAAFDARQAAPLTYFDPVAATPGFPRALARTLHEIRLAGVSAAQLSSAGPSGTDIARLLEHFEAQLAAVAIPPAGSS